MSTKEKQKNETTSMSGVLNWISQLLKIKLTRIEELGSGAVFCQIFELVHPGTIPMHKVNWQAKNQHQFTANLKLLQDAFARTNIKRPLQPLKLAKAKCPDNYDLAVWLRKHYFDNIQDTDCTLNSSLSSKADFSFAHKEIVPKHFGLSQKTQSDALCQCVHCLPSQNEQQLRKKICQLGVKIEMIRQLLGCEENADWKIAIIQEIIGLSYVSKP